MALTWTFETDTYGPGGDAFGYQHTIQVIDREGGISGTFCGRNAVLSTNAPSRDISNVSISSTSLTFDMKIENDTHLSFVNALTDFNERRFVVQYIQSGTFGGVMFTGLIFLDEVTITLTNDVRRSGTLSPNGFFTVTAIDGITLLKSVEYNQGALGSELPYRGRATIGTVLSRCFDSLITSGFGQRAVLASNWTSDTGGTDFFTDTQVSQEILFEEGRQGGYKYKSKYDVIKHICEAFDLRVYIYNNNYTFEQLNARAGGGIINYTWYNLLTFGVTGSGFFPTAQYVVDCNINWRLSPDVRTYKPPLQTSKVIYDVKFLANYLGGETWNSTLSGVVDCTDPLGTVPVPAADTFRARWAGTIQCIPRITAGGSQEGQYWIVFRFQIKIGTYYWVREVVDNTNYVQNFRYNAAEWTTTAGYYEHVYEYPITLPDRYDVPFYPTFFITTGYIPAAVDGEEITACFGHELYDSDGNSVSPSDGGSGTGVEHILTDSDLIVIDGDDAIVEGVQIDKVIYNGNQVDNSRGTERTIIFSTGPTDATEARLTDDSSPPVTQEQWTGEQGTFTHYELLARTIMARATTTQEFIEGGLKGKFGTGINGNVLYDNKEWVPIRVDYEIDRSFYRGEWWRANVGTAAGLPDTEEEIRLINRLPNGFGGATGQPLQPIIYDFIGAYKCVDVDANNMQVPDMTGWTDAQIFARVEVYKQGVGLLYYKFEGTRVDEWWWDNDNRRICLGEQTRAEDKLVIRVWAG